MNLNFLYHVEAVDEFNRVFDANAIINGQHLIFKEIADTAYLQMFQLLATSILSRMGTDAKATWTCTVTEEEV